MVFPTTFLKAANRYLVILKRQITLMSIISKDFFYLSKYGLELSRQLSPHLVENRLLQNLKRQILSPKLILMAILTFFSELMTF